MSASALSLGPFSSVYVKHSGGKKVGSELECRKHRISLQDTHTWKLQAAGFSSLLMMMFEIQSIS